MSYLNEILYTYEASSECERIVLIALLEAQKNVSLHASKHASAVCLLLCPLFHITWNDEIKYRLMLYIITNQLAFLNLVLSTALTMAKHSISLLNVKH